MGTHANILAWKIPWTEKPDGLQSMGSQRVTHNLTTKQQGKLSFPEAKAVEQRESQGGDSLSYLGS